MSTNEFRPKILDELDGQPRAVNMLKSFAAKPENAPNCLLFHGTYGVGKTSAAWAFAHALNKTTEPAEVCNYIREFNCACLDYDAIAISVTVRNSPLCQTNLLCRKLTPHLKRL
jgi:DNA polymerase III gamma/tau subunit